jgi:hypothetical protein
VPNSPAEIYGLRLLTAHEILNTEFGKLGYFKIPTDQQINDLAPQAEFGIVVGYEASSPSNLKVYVPTRRQVVVRSHGRDASLTELMTTELTTICEDNASEADFVWMDDNEHVESCIKDLGSFNLSVKEAYKTLDKDAVDASILSELENMKRYDVWEYTKIEDLNSSARKSILPCKLFLKEKLDAGGNFVKLKSRLVAGGHRQRDESFDQTHSPTVDISSVFMSLGLCTYLENAYFGTADIPAAYLNSPLKETLYMRLPSSITPLIVLENPGTAPLVNTDGTLIVRLKKSMYGLKQAAYDWFIQFSETIKSQCHYLQSSVLVKSSMQKLVSISSTEAEMIALVAAVQRVLPLRDLLLELGIEFDCFVKIYEVNQSCIANFWPTETFSSEVFFHQGAY